MANSKKGIVLVNTGTPSHCDSSSVAKYLRQFLMDARVIDLPFLARWILVNLLIVPFRTKKSLNSYQKIWTEDGSPLLANTKKLKKGLENNLGEKYQIEIAMNYGSPSIEQALNNLKSCSDIKIIPLFPQYASASSGSTLETSLKYFSNQWMIPKLKTLNHFYDQPSFINAYSKIISQHLVSKVDKIIFSYHGLPERHIKKSECACNGAKNLCYRCQCIATTTLLANQLNLKESEYLTAFQSRLGATPWIKPYTDHVLIKLSKQGIKNIAVVCPSFVADCLETVEEINIRARKQWQELGGNKFIFIPSLNDHPDWVSGLELIIESF